MSLTPSADPSAFLSLVDAIVAQPTTLKAVLARHALDEASFAALCEQWQRYSKERPRLTRAVRPRLMVVRSLLDEHTPAAPAGSAAPAAMPDATLALEDSPATGRRATLPFAAIAPTDLLSANRPAPSSPTSPAAASEPRNHYLDLLWADERQAAPLRLAFRELLESLDPEHSPQDGLRGDVLDIMSLATFEDARQLLARSSSSARRFVPPWLVAAGSLRVHPDPAEMLRCTHALLQVSPQAGKQELSALAVVQPHLDPALLGLDGLAARLLQYLEQSYAGADKHAAFASAREVVVRTLMLQRTFSKMVLLGERRVMAALHHADSAIGLCIAEDAALSLPPCEVFDAVVIGQVHPPQHDGEPLLCAHAIARRHALTAA